MKSILARSRIVFVAISLACSVNVFGRQEAVDVDAPMRAKMMKEKNRRLATERMAAREQQKAEEQPRSWNQSDCQGQKIGNLAPPAEFAFAPPNANNFGGRGACR